MQNESQQDLRNNLTKEPSKQCNTPFCNGSLRGPSSRRSLLEKYRGKTQQRRLLNEILRKYFKEGLKNEIEREVKANRSEEESDGDNICSIDEIQEIVNSSPLSTNFEKQDGSKKSHAHGHPQKKQVELLESNKTTPMYQMIVTKGENVKVEHHKHHKEDSLCQKQTERPEKEYNGPPEQQSENKESHKKQTEVQDSSPMASSQESHEILLNKQFHNFDTPPEKLHRSQVNEQYGTSRNNSKHALENPSNEQYFEYKEELKNVKHDHFDNLEQGPKPLIEFKSIEHGVIVESADNSHKPEHLPPFHSNERVNNHFDKPDVFKNKNLQKTTNAVVSDEHSILDHETSNESLRTYASSMYMADSQKKTNYFWEESDLGLSHDTSYASFAIKEPERPIMCMIKAKISEELAMKSLKSHSSLDFHSKIENGYVQSVQEHIHEPDKSEEQPAPSEVDILNEMKRASRADQLCDSQKETNSLISEDGNSNSALLYSKIKNLLNQQNKFILQNKSKTGLHQGNAYSKQAVSDKQISMQLQDTAPESEYQQKSIDRINNFPVRMTKFSIRKPVEIKLYASDPQLVVEDEKEDVLQQEIHDIEEIKIFNLSENQDVEGHVEPVDLNEALTVISLKKEQVEAPLLSSCNQSDMIAHSSTPENDMNFDKDGAQSRFPSSHSLVENIAMDQVQNDKKETDSQIQQVIDEKIDGALTGHQNQEMPETYNTPQQKREERIDTPDLTQQEIHDEMKQNKVDDSSSKHEKSDVSDYKNDQTVCEQSFPQDAHSSEATPLIQNIQSGDGAEILRIHRSDPQRRIFNLYEPYQEVFNKLYNQYHIEECTSLRVCGAANIIGKMNYREVKNDSFASFNWIQVSDSTLSIYGPEHTFLRGNESDFLSPTLNERFHKRINKLNLSNTKMYLRIFDGRFTLQNTLKMFVCDKNYRLIDITDKHVSGLHGRGDFYEVEMVHRLSQDLLSSLKRQREEMEDLLVVLEEKSNDPERENQIVHLSCESETGFMNWLSVFFMRIHGLRAH